MRKRIKYPEGVAVIRGNDRAIQMCIDNLKLSPNIEYCDFRNIDYMRYIRTHKPDLNDDEIMYEYENGNHEHDVYRLYVKDIQNIIKENMIDVLIVNNSEYVAKLMIKNEIWSRNIVNLNSINYFVKLISKISDQKNNICE